jgi:hypothetical protein
METTGSGKGAILIHFARHMEDIALAILPRDIDSEASSEAEPRIENGEECTTSISYKSVDDFTDGDENPGIIYGSMFEGTTKKKGYLELQHFCLSCQRQLSDSHTRYCSDSCQPPDQDQNNTIFGATAASTKRKYRRHPKVDEHAPELPASAYVIFSNQVRETMKGQNLSFTEIAKIVGDRWKVLPLDDRELLDRQATAAKEKYYIELAEYKKTPQYSVYCEYLTEFKAMETNPRGNTSTSMLGN